MRLAFRLSGFFAALLVLLPPHLILFFVPAWRHIVPLIFFRLMLRLINVRLALTGPMPQRGTLIVANHVSWFDIIVIGALQPLSFIAKSEVKSWPLFGQLARLHDSLFVERRIGRHALKERDALAKRLRRGDNLVLFAEGTSSHGLRVLPFKSTLFSAIENNENRENRENSESHVQEKGQDKSQVKGQVHVQAMTLAYMRVHNIPLGRRQRMAYGWIGDMTLVPHFLFMLAGPPLTVEIIFHPPLPRPSALTRKQMAKILHHQVSEGLDALAHGTPHPVAPLEMTGQKS
jgi:1-acyl-sn-glycerol-3-phosphate acyltransferase